MRLSKSLKPPGLASSIMQIHPYEKNRSPISNTNASYYPVYHKKYIRIIVIVIIIGTFNVEAEFSLSFCERS